MPQTQHLAHPSRPLRGTVLCARGSTSYPGERIMNKNAKLWVEALRSGKYTQTRNRLCDYTTDSYCCLGVACEVFIKNSDIPLTTRDSSYDQGRYYGGKIGSLPSIVRKWLGLYDTSGAFIDRNFTSQTLAILNDGGTTFDEIANIIESEPHGLFIN